MATEGKKSSGSKKPAGKPAAARAIKKSEIVISDAPKIEAAAVASPIPQPVPPQGLQPRASDYIKAILQMLWAWVKGHKKAVSGIILVVVLLILGLHLYDGHKNRDLSNDELIITVSRELNIKNDTNPAILTVIDKEKVNQPFLDDSKEGDKVLLYYKSQKAVLFRPSENKIIKTGSYTPPDAKIQIRNGTTSQKRVDAVTASLKTVAGAKISTQDASVKTDYSETLVISVTDRYEKETAAVAKALNAQVRTIPQNESLPDADILVIVGAK